MEWHVNDHDQHQELKQKNGATIGSTSMIFQLGNELKLELSENLMFKSLYR